MKDRWMFLVSLVFTWASLGCFYSWDDPEADDEYLEMDSHNDEVARRALTSPAPPPSGPGYTAGATWGSCEVQADCDLGYVCVGDPSCPDILWCQEIEYADCSCSDRFNTVCFEGNCVQRGADCESGCPEGSTCDEEWGLCVVPPGEFVLPEEPAESPEPEVPVEEPEPEVDEFETDRQPTDGDKCRVNADCVFGSCIDGACLARGCETESTCASEQICAPSLHETMICLVRGEIAEYGECSGNADCASGYCVDALCREPCAISWDCGEGECHSLGEDRLPVCSSELCGDVQCEDHEYCESGECLQRDFANW